jgi:hypothetical protein
MIGILFRFSSSCSLPSLLNNDDDAASVQPESALPLTPAMVKVTGSFQKSSEIMKMTNQLMKLPQLSATMREMSMEMMKVSRAYYCQSHHGHLPPSR